MAIDMKQLEVVKERIFVVHDRKTGKIVHVHSVVTHRGAEPMGDDEAQRRALTFAGNLGHATDKLQVLRADDYKHQPAQKVDVKIGKLVTQKQSPAKRRSR